MINEFSICNFRKLRSVNYQFEKKNLLITGKNAQGKTSIAEALYFCAFLYSPNTKKKAELINFEEQYSLIDIKGDNDIRVMISPKELKLAVNEKEVTTSKDLIGKLKILYLDPKTIKLVEDSSTVRRQFLNVNISQANIEYYDLINKYNIILKQKRKLLKQHECDIDYLRILNKELLSLNTKIIAIRQDYLKELRLVTQNVCDWLTKTSEQIDYTYEVKEYTPGIEQKEIKYKSALWGNHLDIIDFQINKLDVRTYASQGQKRTLSLSLNIAQMEMIKQITNEYPIVIFDDIFSEIDHMRQSQLYKLINQKSQIIMITPQITNISPKILEHKNLKQITIDNGKLL